MVSTRLITAGLVANRNRSGYGTLKQDPLPDGPFRQHLIDQMRRTVHHVPGTAGGTESTPFATERYQFFVMAGFAAYPQEAVFQTAALEVI